MRGYSLCLLTIAAVMLCSSALTGHSGTGDKQIVIEARFIEVHAPRFDLGISHYPYICTGCLTDVSYKSGKKFKKNGVKHRGIRMKAKRDGAYCSVSLGRKFSATDPITFTGTIQLQSMKGIGFGSNLAVCFESTFVPVGGQFDNYLIAGAFYESGGLRAYTGLNGSDVGASPFFPGAMSLDFQVELDPGGVTVDIKPTESQTWTNLVTALGFPLDQSVGISIHMFGIDKGATAITGDIRIEGPSIWADPVLTPILADVDDLRQNLADAHTAMTRLDGEGDPDPDIAAAEVNLRLAAALRTKLVEDIAAARYYGDLHRDTPFDDVLKKLGKAERKLLQVLDNIPAIGQLFRNKDAKRVRKAELLIYVTGKLLTVGDED